MRLGQLARQLHIEPKKIVIFLEKQGVTIEDSPNFKMDDDILELVTKQFEKPVEVEPIKEEIPEPVKEPIEVVEPTIEKEEIQEVQKEEIKETEKVEEVEEVEEIKEVEVKEPKEEPLPVESIEKAVEKPEEVTEELTKQTPEDEKTEEDNEPLFLEIDGVIRAPKVILDGIKVVGKIDLPEPKTKEEVVTETEAKEEPTSTPSEVVVETNEPKIHPNKQARLATKKPKQVIKKKGKKKKVHVPLTKEEAKAERKANKVQGKKAPRKKPQTKKKGKKKKVVPVKKRGFWARLFGFGK